MSVTFPDVSNHQGNLSLNGAAACIAKATEGTTFQDQWYTAFRLKADALAIPFAAYHWLHAADVLGQARLAFAVVGAATPLMIDDEEPIDGLDINRTLAFVKAYRALGGTVTMEYCPRWHWEREGSPDLRPLAAAGLALVSSNYSQPYSDTGVGWNPYGGVTPSIWQYTSSQPFNGSLVDFNGFRGGGVAELDTLFRYGPNGKVNDMQRYQITADGEGKLWLTNGMTARPISGQAEVDDIKYLAEQGAFELWHGGEVWRGLVPAHGVKIPWSGGTAGGGATPVEVSAAMRAELDKTTLSGVPGKLGH